jgi:hypothetical protein
MANNVLQLSESMIALSNQCQVSGNSWGNESHDRHNGILGRGVKWSERAADTSWTASEHTFRRFIEVWRFPENCCHLYLSSPVNPIALFQKNEAKVTAADNPEQVFLQWILNRGASPIKNCVWTVLLQFHIQWGILHHKHKSL